jgi:hypothetical protein
MAKNFKPRTPAIPNEAVGGSRAFFNTYLADIESDLANLSADAKATATFTTQPLQGDAVHIDGVHYVFQNGPDIVAGTSANTVRVEIGIDIEDSIKNLHNAIRGVGLDDKYVIDVNVTSPTLPQDGISSLISPTTLEVYGDIDVPVSATGTNIPSWDSPTLVEISSGSVSSGSPYPEVSGHLYVNMVGGDDVAATADLTRTTPFATISAAVTASGDTGNPTNTIVVYPGLYTEASGELDLNDRNMYCYDGVTILDTTIRNAGNVTGYLVHNFTQDQVTPYSFLFSVSSTTFPYIIELKSFSHEATNNTVSFRLSIDTEFRVREESYTIKSLFDDEYNGVRKCYIEKSITIEGTEAAIITGGNATADSSIHIVGGRIIHNDTDQNTNLTAVSEQFWRFIFERVEIDTNFGIFRSDTDEPFYLEFIDSKVYSENPNTILGDYAQTEASDLSEIVFTGNCHFEGTNESTTGSPIDIPNKGLAVQGLRLTFRNGVTTVRCNTPNTSCITFRETNPPEHVLHRVNFLPGFGAAGCVVATVATDVSANFCMSEDYMVSVIGANITNVYTGAINTP